MKNYGWGLPIAAATYARNIDFGIWVIHVAMVGIFVLWGIFFAYLLIKYRRRPGAAVVRETEHGGELKSLLPDFAVMAFEIALIAFYALPVWSRIKMKMPDDKDAVVIGVVGEQFAWDIHYPGPDGKFGRRKPELVHFNNPLGLDKTDPAAADDVIVANELHMPVGRKVLIKLASKDVIHDFFIPEFRIKQDAVPGLEIPVWIEPDRVGKYELACAQLCGFAHSLMRADVYVDTPEDYEKWLKSRAAAAPAPAKPANPAEDF
jgi:cytochrome c oxidase subunit 2